MMASSRALAVLALAITGCGDPLVSLSVDAPGRSNLALTLRILEPPAAQPIRCDDLAFGEQSLDDSLRYTVRQVSLAGAFDLSQLDRRSAHVFLVEGVDPQGRRVAIGCADLAHAEGGETLRVVLEPVVVVHQPFDSAQASLEAGAPLAVAYILTDMDGNAIGSIAAKWRLYAGGDHVTRGDVTTSTTATIVVRPEVPRFAGPMTIELRARWAQPPVTLTQGFIRNAIKGDALTDKAYALGRFDGDGRLQLARYNPQMRRVEICHDLAPIGACVGVLPLGPQDIGLLRLDGAASDRLLVIASSDGWTEIGGGSEHTKRPWTAAPSGAVPQTIHPSGECPEASAVVVPSTNGVQEVSASAAPRSIAEGLGALVPLRSGCVSDDRGALRRTIALFRVMDQQPIIWDESNAKGEPWFGPPAAFGFARAPERNANLLLGLQFERSSLGISRAQWMTAGPTATVLQIGDFDLLNQGPERNGIGGGDVDGDGTLDLLALTTDGMPNGSSLHRLWVALGQKTSQGMRVIGSLDLAPLCTSTLTVGDVDGDRLDDAVIVEDCASCGACPAPGILARAIVVRMGP
jgi:hypothetical protein